MAQRCDTYNRQMSNYGHTCCKNCFGNEQSFKNARRLAMLNNNPFKGKQHSAETKVKLSEGKKGSTPWNKGNKKAKKPIIPGSINKWMEFKRTIIDRDCSDCWKCGTKNRIEVHHMESKKRYPEHHYNQDNCITLCYWCHKDFHKEFGRYKFEYYNTITWLNRDRKESEKVFFC